MRRILLSFVFASPLGAQSRFVTQVGDFIFNMPPGWGRTVQRGDTTYLPSPNAIPGTTTVITLVSRNLAGDVKATFNANWIALVSGTRLVQNGGSGIQNLADGTPAYYANVTVADHTGHQWNVALVGAQYQQKYETVTFITDDFRQGTRTSDIGAFRTLILGLRFGPPNTIASHDASGFLTNVPVAKGSGHALLLLRNFMGATNTTPAFIAPGVMANVAYGRKAAYISVLPDGRLYNGLLRGGFDQVDEDAAIKNNPVGWAPYDLAGTTLHYVFPLTSIYDKGLKPIEKTMDLTDPSWPTMYSGDSIALDGRFRREDADNGGPTQGITFTPDGRFSDEGAFRAATLATNASTGQGYDHLDDGVPGQGTYRIARYTLELTFADHRYKQGAFFLEHKPTGPVREIFIMGQKFVRATP